MKKFFIPLFAVVALVAWKPAQENQGGKKFMIMLTGSQEVNGGDPDGSGMATITLNQGQGTLTYEIWVENIGTNVIGAHIHEAPRGSAGPVVEHLNPPVNGYSSGVIQLTKEEVKEYRQNPEAYYINVHTAEYPGGAVRGQLQ